MGTAMVTSPTDFDRREAMDSPAPTSPRYLDSLTRDQRRAAVYVAAEPAVTAGLMAYREAWKAALTATRNTPAHDAAHDVLQDATYRLVRAVHEATEGLGTYQGDK